MLLFVGYSMALHSAPVAMLLLAVCALYYSSRTRLEAQVLREAFGGEYEQYAARTKKYLPGLI
jgi:protein-S-isoprenylcysteine O-methyltransferase Ste14